MSASSLPDREHDERAVGLRDAHRFALAAVEPGLPQNPPWRQDVCSPSRQNSHVPSDQTNGATTRSPFFTVRTSAPTSSTTPMNSCPMRRPVGAGLHLLVRPQIAAADAGARDADERVRRFDNSGSGTVSTRTSPAPYINVARMSTFPPRVPRRGRVILVGDLLHPLDRFAVQLLPRWRGGVLAQQSRSKLSPRDAHAVGAVGRRRGPA